jgi:small subunit ribosomal protein S18
MAERRKYKKRYCKYCEAKVDFMDYKDAGSLRFSLSERYKIMPRRLTGNCKRHQEMVTIAIKRVYKRLDCHYLKTDQKKTPCKF